MNDVYLYPYSSEEARRRDELSLWRASHQENISCKKAIEEAVRQHFDGSHLDNDRPASQSPGTSGAVRQESGRVHDLAHYRILSIEGGTEYDEH